MAQRARRRGIRGAAVRVARAALAEHDEESARISQGVYNVTHASRDVRGSRLGVRIPLWMQGPLLYVAEMAAAKVAARQGFPPEETQHVAAYLFDGFLNYAVAILVEFDQEHYETWLAQRAAEDGGGDGHGNSRGASPAHGRAAGGEAGARASG